jgi:hypothetical protein
MATSVSLGYPLWTDGMTFNSQLGRVFGQGHWECKAGSSFVPLTGVVSSSPNPLAVTAAGSMNLSVLAGSGVIPNAAGSSNGTYMVGMVSAVTLVVPTANPSNPRIDLIIASVHDNGDATSYSAIELIQGTPASSPSVPTPPGGVSYIPLAQVAVGAGVTSISSGNITDKRTFTTGAGGVVRYPSGASGSSGNGGHVGRVGYDVPNNRFFHDDATTSRGSQMQFLPWAPQKSYYNGANLSVATSDTTLASVNITTDGNTDIDIWFDIYGFLTGSGSNAAFFNVYVDSTNIFRQYAGLLVNSGLQGYSLHWRTGSESSDTPSAGTHTVYIKANAGAGAGGCQAHSPWKLIVEPVKL